MRLVYTINLSFLLFVFITNFSIAFSSDDVEEVLDITGKPVIRGNKYYIIPPITSITDTGGGLELGKTSNTNCEVTILQNDNAFVFGRSVKFTNLDNSTEKILTSKPVEIEVSEKPDCAESSKWIAFVDEITRKICVGIGGDKNYYDLLQFPGSFDILKHGSGYQFGFRIDGSDDNFYIGSYENSGEDGKRLYLAGQEIEDPFEFVFLPASFETGIVKSVA